MTKRLPKGRRRVAIKRAHAVYLIIAAHPGEGPRFIQDTAGITSGQWQTAIKYLLQDGLVEQYGQRKGARYYPSGDINNIDVLEVLGGDTNKSIHIEPNHDGNCTFCDVSPVDSFKFYTKDDDDDDLPEKEYNANVVAAMRQAFHMCKRCANFRMPSTSASVVRNDKGWEDEYDQWQNPDIGVELTVKFKNWIYGITSSDTYQLFAIVSLPDIDDNKEYYLGFTFTDTSTGQTRYVQRLLSHPDHLIGNKVVVSREKHKIARTSGASWFWSWTPWPRIPAHLRRESNANDEMAATTQLDGPVPDASVPQHHIHSVQDHGAYTVIRINKNVSEINDSPRFVESIARVNELEETIKLFLYGGGTIADLVQIIEGDE